MRILLVIFVVLVAIGMVKRDKGTWKEYLCAFILSMFAAIGIMLL